MLKTTQINSFQSIESIEAEINYYKNVILDNEIDTDCINWTLDYIEHISMYIFKLEQLLKTKKAGLGPCSLVSEKKFFIQNTQKKEATVCTCEPPNIKSNAKIIIDMSNVKNKPKRSKHNAKISIKKGYFGLRIKGNLPQDIRRKAATLGKYWSAYSVEEYFELREQHINIYQLSGWYYSSDIISLLNINNIKYYLQ